MSWLVSHVAGTYPLLTWHLLAWHGQWWLSLSERIITHV